MEIDSKRYLVARHIAGTRGTHATTRANVLVLQLIIHEHIERAANGVRHIYAGEPVFIVLLRTCGPTPDGEALVPREAGIQAHVDASGDLRAERSSCDIRFGSLQKARTSRHAVIVGGAQ